MQDKTVPEYLLKLCREAKQELSAFNYRYYGLCSLLSAMHDLIPHPHAEWHAVDLYKDDLMRRWPESGGRNSYPVSVPWELLTYGEIEVLMDVGLDDDASDKQLAMNLFDLVDNEKLHGGDFWDRDTEYGRARWRLLDWMIEELEKELEK